MFWFLEIDPVAIDLGFIQIRWYGVAYAVGILAAVILGKIRAGLPGAHLKSQNVIDLVLFVALGAIVGGRVGYGLFYQPGYYIGNPLEMLKIWQGGMSFHGGLLGAFAGGWIFSRKFDVPILRVADFSSPLCAIGLFFGRIANFINQELWGRPTDVPWAIVFPADPERLPRHPSQLYEALLEGLVLFAVLWVFSAKPRPAGAVTGIFLAGYGLFRFTVEFFREPDAPLGFILLDWVTMGQILSLPLILAGILLLGMAMKRSSPAS
ncbi:MAG: prolipoprotein diacylglyceryl transferase [Acidiferrobacterales bacterium]|nr:prolipoprotein diacylglyceryl transferase [Acidiferrobacterales bacterium]